MERLDQVRASPPALAAQRRFMDIASAVLASINGGVYPPMSRLPGDRELAAAHGVSRTTAREALLALELVGAVTIRHGDGVYVSPASSTRIDESEALLSGEPRDLIEARISLEPTTSRLAALRITDEQITVLADLVDEAEEAGSSGDYRRFAVTGFAFHSRLAGYSGNALLAEFIGQLVSIEHHPLWVLVNEQALRSTAARLEQVAEHRAVIAALRERDAEQAERSMRTHLTGVQSTVFPSLPSNPPNHRSARRIT